MGFYCTEDVELAKEWAVSYDRDGYSNTYLIDDSGLNVLQLDSVEYTALHWIEMLISNRTFDVNTPIAMEAIRYLQDNFHVDTSDADVIIGYRADDSYFTYAREFLNNTISYEQLVKALRLGNLGQQYVLKNQRAFDAIQFVEAYSVKSEEYYPRKALRDSEARKAYRKMVPADIYNDIFMINILREEMKADDSRLQ